MIESFFRGERLMESSVSEKKPETAAAEMTGTVKTAASKDDYRDSIRKQIEVAIKTALDEEMRKATQELMEEQRKAVRQILEEQKAALREIVAEEKKAIWARAEDLRKSIIKLGL